MKNNFVLFTVLLAAVVLSGCKKEEDQTTYYEQEYPPTAIVIKQAVTDYDGNIYDAVQIGDQIWMASNLRTKHYADGTAIWENRGTWSICYTGYYGEGLTTIHGYRYNLSAALRGGVYPGITVFYDDEENPPRVQGICPNGWHLPNAEEFRQLCYSINNNVEVEDEYTHQSAEDIYNQVETGKALAARQEWEPSGQQYGIGNNLNSNNATGFSALPCAPYSDEERTEMDRAEFHTCTYSDGEYGGMVWTFSIHNKYGVEFSSTWRPVGGCSDACVRCVKD